MLPVNTINSVLETAALNAPVIIQFSWRRQFNAGKGLSNVNEKQQRWRNGSKHIHALAERMSNCYNASTTAQKPLPDGLLDASEENFAATGKPLYSSHMIDLSEEPIEENIEICKGY
jgi:fructose-bisphosphate aldolase class II